jgi:uncharacterized membrane protein
MKTLIVLIVVFIAATGISRLTSDKWNLTFAGNLAMCVMLCFTALGHVMYTKGMALMIPPFIPFKEALVYITGVAEILMGIALMIPSMRAFTGAVLIIFFLLLLPANIYAAMVHLDFQKATYTGVGTNYLWFRIPEQLLFIGWVYYFAI